jgi:nitrate reductase NapAB chaperone NapD
MPISGVIVVCEEASREAVRHQVDAHPRLDVSESTGPALIAITDTESVEQDRADVEWLGTLEGVLSTHVAFTNIEDVGETQ